MDYSAPSDFYLPSPPYYRPASSVSLTCVAYNAVGTVKYHWLSTNTNSFVHMATGHNITQNILTAFDAGDHTCVAEDELGNFGSAVTPMTLIGRVFIISILII